MPDPQRLDPHLGAASPPVMVWITGGQHESAWVPAGLAASVVYVQGASRFVR